MNNSLVRSIEDDRDKMKTLLDNQCYMTLKISNSRIENHLGMFDVCHLSKCKII